MTKKVTKAKLSKEEIDEMAKLVEGEEILEDEDKNKDDDEDEGTEKKDKDKADPSYKMKKESIDAFANLLKEQEDLSPELAAKVVTMFEALVVEHVNEAIPSIKKEIQAALEESLEEELLDLAEKTNNFLTLKTNEWFEANEPKVVEAAKVEKAEKMLEGLKSLFSENSIVVVENEVNEKDELQKTITELQAKLGEEVEKTIALNKKIQEAEKETALKEATKGLSESEVGRFKKLAGGVVFENFDKYKQSLVDLKETIFVDPKKSASLNEGAPLIDTKSVDGKRTFDSIFDQLFTRQ